LRCARVALTRRRERARPKTKKTKKEESSKLWVLAHDTHFVVAEGRVVFPQRGVFVGLDSERQRDPRVPHERMPFRHTLPLTPHTAHQGS